MHVSQAFCTCGSWLCKSKQGLISSPSFFKGQPVPVFPANTFLIGAQKSGTTFLAALLEQSLDVCVSNPKEPHYLTHFHDRGPGYYAKCFDNPAARIRLDASTTYTVLRPRAQFDVPDAPGILDPVPQRIKDMVPDAKLIYIMRDPVKRAISAYRHHARSKPGGEASLSLLECMKADPMLVLTGQYGAQIERYFEVFPPEQFLFLDFRDLTRAPQEVLQKTCDFLKIDCPRIASDMLGSKRNANYQPTTAGRLVDTVRSVLPSAVQTLRQALPNTVERAILDKVLRKPSKITFYDADEATPLFAEDRIRVKQLTGLDI